MATFAKKPKITLGSTTEVKSSKKLELYVATLGYLYPECEEGKFYPLNMADEDRLKYYASKFNSVLISSTFFGQPKTEIYLKWLQSVSDNPNFKFIISAPKLLTHSKTVKDIGNIWKFFWEGNDRRGGCKIIHQSGKLGCILVEFPNIFCFSRRNVNKLKSIMSIIPSDIKIAAEFRHWSWWEHRQDTEQIFKEYPEWCISAPYVENGLVGCGWAGTIPSTRVQNDKESMPIVQTTDFTFLSFYGTMGKYLGSYDDKSFLERVVARIKDQQTKGINTVFCSFNNTDSSYCYPLPGIYLAGLPLRPKIKELPSHTQIDLPCCLHDAQRFEKVWKEIEEYPYQIDERGHAELSFYI